MTESAGKCWGAAIYPLVAPRLFPIARCGHWLEIEIVRFIENIVLSARRLACWLKTWRGELEVMFFAKTYFWNKNTKRQDLFLGLVLSLNDQIFSVRPYAIFVSFSCSDKFWFDFMLFRFLVLLHVADLFRNPALLRRKGLLFSNQDWSNIDGF